jgi:hypothetical protein
MARYKRISIRSGQAMSRYKRISLISGPAMPRYKRISLIFQDMGYIWDMPYTLYGSMDPYKV